MVYTVRISVGQRARVVIYDKARVYNLLRDVNITVASTQYEHEREKILSHVNSRPCHLYNKKMRQEL